MKRDEQIEQNQLPRKTWSTPQMVTVDIAEMTEGMFNPGDDGAGSSTLS